MSMLNRIFTDVAIQDGHGLHNTSLPNVLTKPQQSDALLHLCVSPIGSCCSTEVAQLSRTVVWHFHGNMGCSFQACCNLIAQLLTELLLCLELKAMLRRISSSISSTAWLEEMKWENLGQT